MVQANLGSHDHLQTALSADALFSSCSIILATSISLGGRRLCRLFFSEIFAPMHRGCCGSTAKKSSGAGGECRQLVTLIESYLFC